MLNYKDIPLCLESTRLAANTANLTARRTIRSAGAAVGVNLPLLPRGAFRQAMRFSTILGRLHRIVVEYRYKCVTLPRAMPSYSREGSTRGSLQQF